MAYAFVGHHLSKHLYTQAIFCSCPRARFEKLVTGDSHLKGQNEEKHKLSITPKVNYYFFFKKNVEFGLTF